MQFYRCKCGASRSWGSMPPPLCARCGACGSDLAPGPSLHREPKPHEYLVEQVATDAGPAPLTRCRWCMKTKAELEGK